MAKPRETLMRADKLLAGLGYGSRREVGIAIRNGYFEIDGEPYKATDGKLVLRVLAKARATFDGEPLEPLPPLTVLVNKPAGFICSREDAGSLVFDLLPERWRRRNPPLSVAGRLDKDSTGLVVLSDDGEFVHRMISPHSDTPKHYLVTLAKPLSGGEAELFASGTVMLRGEKKPLRPAEMEILDSQKVRLVLHEGRYHQVRRMFASVGNEVTGLHRERIGSFSLGDIEEGAYDIFAPGTQ